MKKFCLMLCAFLLFTLCACAKQPVQEQPAPATQTQLPAEETSGLKNPTEPVNSHHLQGQAASDASSLQEQPLPESDKLKSDDLDMGTDTTEELLKMQHLLDELELVDVSPDNGDHSDDLIVALSAYKDFFAENWETYREDFSTDDLQLGLYTASASTFVLVVSHLDYWNVHFLKYVPQAGISEIIPAYLNKEMDVPEKLLPQKEKGRLGASFDYYSDLCTTDEDRAQLNGLLENSVVEFGAFLKETCPEVLTYLNGASCVYMISTKMVVDLDIIGPDCISGIDYSQRISLAYLPGIGVWISYP